MQIKQTSLKMHRNAKKQHPIPMLLKQTLMILIFLQNSEDFPYIQTECHYNFVKIREILSKSATTFHRHILNSSTAFIHVFQEGLSLREGAQIVKICL